MSGNGHGVCDFYCVSPLSASGAEPSFSVMAKNISYILWQLFLLL
jgi:hypothetical protein